VLDGKKGFVAVSLADKLEKRANDALKVVEEYRSIELQLGNVQSGL
jgi:hypothetical protein